MSLRRRIKETRARYLSMIKVPDDNPWLARLRNKTRQLFLKDPGHPDTLQMACLASCPDQVLLFIAGHNEWEAMCLREGKFVEFKEVN